MHAEPVLYSDMMDVARTELEQAGMAEAGVIARRIATSFCETHNEKYYRVPNLLSIRKRDRDEAIVRDRETMSVKEIAKKYELTTNVVYLILRDGE